MTDTTQPPSSASSLERDIQLTFEQAAMHHRAGQLQEAGNLYRAILQIQQNHPGANHSLGVLLVQARQPAAGLAYLEAALTADPESQQYWLDYIDALILAGRPDTARQVLALGRQHGLQGEALEALAERLAAGQSGQLRAVQLHDVNEASTAPEALPDGKKRPKHAKRADAAKEAHTSRGKEPTAQEMASLAALLNQGHYLEGETRARNLTEQFPQYGLGWKLLGASLQLQGRDEEALMPLQKTAAMLPWDAEAHSNLGNTLWNMGQLDGAMESYLHALKIKPDYAEAHNNLGNVLRDLGQLDQAAASYRHALEIKPDYFMALNNLGATLQNLGRLDEAVASYRRALEIKPDFSMAWNNLALALSAQGQTMLALNAVCRSLKVNETWENKKIFVDCVRQLSLKLVGADILDFIVRALSEPWGRPSDLARTCINLIKHNPGIRKGLAHAAAAWPQRLPAQDFLAGIDLAAVAADPLLLALLDSAPASDIELERFLTMVRCTMLETAAEPQAPGGINGAILNFYGALARQCFINEYVFATTDEEQRRAHALRDSLAGALEAGEPVSPLWPIAVAAYFPLHTLPFADRLLDRSWPDAVAAVLEQQINEPKEERQCRATMPRLTGIDDGVSLLVQGQYEENPYPRWVKAPPVSPTSIDRFLRRTFPLVDFPPLDKGSDAEILVAGCGTGQQPIQMAQQFSGARVTAVDLSLTSLCYARRKTRELGLNSIEYAQADILKLGSLGRSFDVIASSGVLHHLADPLAGWRVLLSLLRPGGFMFLGFYSEVARRDIARARSYIAEHGYSSSAEGIRSCRQDMMDLGHGVVFGMALKTADFFSTSACRDLLFHVQEHCMVLPGIDAFLRENKLRFLGFDHTVSVISAYHRRFPGDRTATDLNNWEIFENENPDTFFGMYQFWIQKPR